MKANQTTHFQLDKLYLAIILGYCNFRIEIWRLFKNVLQPANIGRERTWYYRGGGGVGGSVNFLYYY